MSDVVAGCYLFVVVVVLLFLFLLAVKVPQIYKIVKAGSVEGLSYVAMFLELLAVTFTCTYNLAKGFNFR